MRFFRSFLVVFTGVLLSGCAPSDPPPQNRDAHTTLITNGQILTMNTERQVLEGGCVLIKGRVIRRVLAQCMAADYPYAKIIDADGDIVMPGMINLHNHLPMIAFRGLAETDIKDVHDRLYNYFFPLEKQLLDRSLIRVSARQAAMEMVLGGVTTTTDMYYHEDEVAKSVKQVGLRGVLGETVIGFPVVDAPTPYGGMDYARKYIKDWQGDNLITPAIAPHAPYSVSPDKLKQIKVLADNLKAPILLHMAEMPGERAAIAKAFPGTTEDKSVVRYLEDIGFLGPSVLAAHVIYVDEADVALLKARGVGISHNPKANSKDNSGKAPAWKMVKAGLAVGLGTDGPMSSNQLDILSVMNYAARLARDETGKVSVYKPSDLVAMATIEGARALHMDDKIGSLEAGKLADIIIVETKSPNMQPNYDPYATLVFSAYPGNVRLTMVGGRIIAREGQILTVDLAAHQKQWQAVMSRVSKFARTLGH